MTSNQRPETRKLLLIDGNNLFHRAYHALPPLTAKGGENVNAVFGFSNMLLKAIGEVKPTYIACAFDTELPTFRHVEFEKYKAQRPPPPPDLYPQLPKVKKVLGAFGIKYFEKEGYEADDLLASIAHFVIASTSTALGINSAKQSLSRHSELGSESKKILKRVQDDKSVSIVILSGDRDVLQLVDGYIKVQMPGWNMSTTTLFGSHEVKEKYGITPEQMVDYKAMIGDTSDNVPGIVGIGPKTASQLLQKYGDLERIYKNLGEISETTRKKLEAGKELALAAKRLVELDRSVDLGFRIDDLKFSPNWEGVREEYEQLGFKSIVGKLPVTGDQRQSDKETMDHEPKTMNHSDQLELI